MWFWRNGHREGPTLVLGGGGSMGALQAGVLRVLMRHGFQPSRIIGTSVGALNGAFLAFYPGMAGAEQLVEVWRGLENERYISLNPVRVVFRLASRQLHLFSNEFLRRLIEQHAVEDDFAAARVPLFIPATNLYTGRKHVFSAGPVSRAILASTAIPGVFGPVEIDGQAYIDGGVVANLDLETAVELGAKEILAIDLSHCFELPEPNSVLDVLTRTVDIVMRERVQRDLELLDGRARITVIRPEIERGPGVGDLSHVSRLIEQGEQLALRMLDQVFDVRGRLVPGVYRAEVVVPD